MWILPDEGKVRGRGRELHKGKGKGKGEGGREGHKGNKWNEREGMKLDAAEEKGKKDEIDES